MARDDLHWAARSIFATTGPQSGHTSSEFHFRFNGPGTPTTTQLNQLATDVAGFWNTNTSTTESVGMYLGPPVYRGANASEVVLYSIDMADPHHYYGSPVTIGTFTLANGKAGGVIPNEAAFVLSYRADYGADPEHGGTTRPRADDRGRVYIGPLSTAACSAVTAPNGTQYAVAATSLVNTALFAITNLANTAFTHNFTLSVWSRKRQQFRDVISKAANTDFDTQRKRGIATTLLTWVTL